jgi:pimeloyl-ACP methyl ester carboxylesterase
MESSEGMIAVDDGVHLYFQKLGTGSRTILIPNGLCFLEDFRHLAEGCTVIFYDVRNRGRSETITDQALLARGIHQDVNDLDAVRRHFGMDQFDLIGHSYMGLTVAVACTMMRRYMPSTVASRPLYFTLRWRSPPLAQPSDS